MEKTEKPRKKYNIKKIIHYTIFKYVVMLVLGVTIGLGSGYALWHKSKPTPKTNTANPFAATTPEQQLARLDKNFERAKQVVAKDKEAGKLTDEQARKINAKLQEIYDYLKAHTSTSSAERMATAEKRKEWRKWAEDNQIAYRYIMVL